MSQIIWSNRIDQRFLVQVERVDGDRGRFTVQDTLEPSEGGLGRLADEEVLLMYQAAFGPDAADVSAWMERGLEVVDAAIGPPAA